MGVKGSVILLISINLMKDSQRQSLFQRSISRKETLQRIWTRLLVHKSTLWRHPQEFQVLKDFQASFLQHLKIKIARL